MYTIPTPSAWTVDLEDYWNHLRAAKRSAETIKLRRYHLRHFAASVATPPREVSYDALAAYLSASEWSANTVRSRRQTLVGFYTWLHRTDRIAKNPTVLLDAVAAKPGVPRPASEDVVREGISLQDKRTRLMVRLAAQAGLRCREIARVHSGDLQRTHDGWELLVHGKGDRQRLVPLNAGLAAELLAQPAGYVFPGRIEGHLSPGYVSKLVSRALPDGVTAHPMRHRFASRAWVGSGRDIRAVQELLGHASVATTQIYTAVPSEAKRLGVEAAA